MRKKHRGEEVHAAPRADRDAPTDLLAALRASVEAAKGGGNGRRRTPPAKSDLESMTADQLREHAADLDIKGRSSMTKKELVGAIRDAA